MCCKTQVWKHTTHVMKTMISEIIPFIDNMGHIMVSFQSSSESPCTGKQNYRTGLGQMSLEKWPYVINIIYCQNQDIFRMKQRTINNYIKT